MRNAFQAVGRVLSGYSAFFGVAACFTALLWAAPVRAEGDDMMAQRVAQFRENVDQVRIILQDVAKEKSQEKKLAAKRDALEALSKAYFALQQIPAKSQEAEDLGESRRYMESTLKDLGADPVIKKARDSILSKAVEAYQGGNIEDASGLFEELRLMDPSNPGISFMVRHLEKMISAKEEGTDGTKKEEGKEEKKEEKKEE